MSIYGYRLVGTAKNARADYIPSLIGIDEQQSNPAGTDTYFERVELPEEAINLTSVSGTRWVSYDSLPSQERDPILAVKAGTLAFYHTLSELTDMVQEYGDGTSQAMVAVVRKGAFA